MLSLLIGVGSTSMQGGELEIQSLVTCSNATIDIRIYLCNKKQTIILQCAVIN